MFIKIWIETAKNTKLIIDSRIVDFIYESFDDEIIKQ